MIPELTKSMPPRLTLSTGLDALSHAMEAFWARKRNPLSQALALHAVECIKCALPSALDGADDPEARKSVPGFFTGRAGFFNDKNDRMPQHFIPADIESRRRTWFRGSHHAFCDDKNQRRGCA